MTTVVGFNQRITVVDLRRRNTSGGHQTENDSHEIQMEYESDKKARTDSG